MSKNKLRLASAFAASWGGRTARHWLLWVCGAFMLQLCCSAAAQAQGGATLLHERSSDAGKSKLGNQPGLHAFLL